MKIHQNISIFSKVSIHLLATAIILLNPTLRGNTPPTELKLSPGFILENQPKNSEIGTLSVTDPDPNDIHTYKIIGGSDDYAFKVSGDKLLAKYTLDYEGTNALKVLIRSTDSSGATLEQELVVHVGNVQEAPDDIFLDKTHIEENVPPGTEVATIAVLDPDNLTGWGYTDLPQDDAGGVSWEFKTGGTVRYPPALGNNGLVYISSFDNKLYAIDSLTGVKRWEFTTEHYSPRTGADILLLFDTTGSMSDKINKVKAIFEPLAEEVMGLMPEVDFNWAVAEYQDSNTIRSGIRVKLKFTDDHTKVKSTISSLRESGGRQGEQQMHSFRRISREWNSLLGANPRSLANRLVIWVGDEPGIVGNGYANVFHPHLDDVINDLTDAEIKVIGINGHGSRSGIDGAGKPYNLSPADNRPQASTIVESTGGSLLHNVMNRSTSDVLALLSSFVDSNISSIL